MLLRSISCTKLFKMPGKETAPFRTSTRCFQVMGRNYRPWKFSFQIPYLCSLSSFRSREIVRIFPTLPCDYVLSLRHYVAIFFIVICFPVSPNQWLSSPLRRHVFRCCCITCSSSVSLLAHCSCSPESSFCFSWPPESWATISWASEIGDNRLIDPQLRVLQAT